MKLTVANRLRICWEVLTTRSGHSHPSQEKQLSTFKRGYDAGLVDKSLDNYCSNSDAIVERVRQFVDSSVYECEPEYTCWKCDFDKLLD